MRNLTSCIKIACDFVSPMCVGQCRGLIEETRRLAMCKSGKKEDVLQLKVMMLYAWEEMGRWKEEDITVDGSGMKNGMDRLDNGGFGDAEIRRRSLRKRRRNNM